MSAPLWRDGWYAFAHAHPSPNHGPRPPGTAIDLLVLHAISLPPGEYGGPQVAQLFTNTLDCDAHPYFAGLRGLEVSAHFFIRRDGALWQFVSVERRAWHAGASHFAGRDNCNDFSVGVELEGLEGETFEEAQYDSLGSLAQALVAQWPIQSVQGHEHIAPGRKGDPGVGFDWRRLRDQLGWPRATFPSTAG